MIFKGKCCHHIWFNWRRFQMQMTTNVNQHGTYTHVGFINNDHLLVCVRTACERLINMDFLVLRHILNLFYFIEQNIEPFLHIVDKWGPRTLPLSEIFLSSSLQKSFSLSLSWQTDSLRSSEEKRELKRSSFPSVDSGGAERDWKLYRNQNSSAPHFTQ